MDLIDSTFVSSSFEGCREKRLDDVYNTFPPDKTFAQRQDVCIVVESGESRCSCRFACGRADAFVFVGGNAHADARAANEDSAVAFSLRNGLGGAVGPVWIVRGLGGICSKILIRYAQFFEKLASFLLEFKSSMVTRKSQHSGSVLLVFQKPHFTRTHGCGHSEDRILLQPIVGCSVDANLESKVEP